MSADIAIQVHEISKAYRIWERPSSRLLLPCLQTLGHLMPVKSQLRGRLTAAAQRHYRDFSALEATNFTVRRGEAVGIIGRNGSGKSTLLQILAGTLSPSTGECVVRGRVAALLELGSGFNPEFTGRENVMLNGAILGFSAAEMTSKFDDIAAFAEIGDFIEQPVKTYSSGMMVRLAFAVAISVEPDVLIVDEALSVGDVFFQQKCFRRVREVLARGTTFLFVSHDTGAVQNLCDRALFLDHGKTVFDGAPEEAVSRYFSSSGELQAPSSRLAATVPTPAGEELAQTLSAIQAHNQLPQARARHGGKRMEFLAAAFFNSRGHPTLNFALGETCQIHLVLRANTEIAEPAAGVRLFDRMANLVFAAGNRQIGQDLPPLAIGETLHLQFDLQLRISPDQFTITVDCSEPSTEGPNHGVFSDVVEGLGPLTVYFDTWKTRPFYGMVQLPLALRHGPPCASPVP